MDLTEIKQYLKEIANSLKKKEWFELDPERIENDKKYRELIAREDRRHREMLATQRIFHRKNLKEQKALVEWTRVLAIATIIMCALTFGVILTTKSSIDKQNAIYSPIITAEITDNELPWAHTTKRYEHVVFEPIGKGIYNLPVYVEISNSGLLPFQLNNILFENWCGVQREGLLSFPANFSKVVASGKSISFATKISIEFQDMLKELPCEVNFTIHGKNVVIEKTIVLKVYK